MSETFVGVLAALVVYRALAIAARWLLTFWVNVDTRRALRRAHSWSGAHSTPMRIAKHLGINTR